MSTTVIGYNLDPNPVNSTSPVQISSTLGAPLVVASTGDIICIPAGMGIVQIQLKLATPTVPLAGTGNNLLLVVDNGTTQEVAMSVSKAILNSRPSVTLYGTDASPIAVAQNVETGLLLKSDVGDFGPAGPVIGVLVKYKSMTVI